MKMYTKDDKREERIKGGSMELSYEKPEVQLTGTNGNAFAVLGKVTRAMRRAGANEEELSEFKEEATSGSYDHLLQTAMSYVEIK